MHVTALRSIPIASMRRRNTRIEADSDVLSAAARRRHHGRLYAMQWAVVAFRIAIPAPQQLYWRTEMAQRQSAH